MKGDYVSTKGDGGTPHWMSPEVLKGQTQLITEKSDVWSFGVVLFEIVTRTMPWKEKIPQAIAYAIFEGERLKMPEDIQPEILSLANDCWNEDPALRPSFSAIIERLSTLKQIYPPGVLHDAPSTPGSNLPEPQGPDALLSPPLAPRSPTKDLATIDPQDMSPLSSLKGQSQGTSSPGQSIPSKPDTNPWIIK